MGRIPRNQTITIQSQQILAERVQKFWEAGVPNIKQFTNGIACEEYFMQTIFFLYQISWIFVINQVPCVSSCWGRRHTPVVCNESKEPHTSHYLSRSVAKRNNQQTTHTSHYRSRPAEFSFEAAMTEV